jgi:cell division inhibitor SepF
MASMWRRAMLYLGLGPDDEYEEFEEHASDVPAPATTGARGTSNQRPGPDATSSGTVRTMTRETTDVPAVTIRPRSSQSAVNLVAAQPPAKPYVVIPASFRQAQEVADRYKDGQPVIVNLQSADRELERRLIDFASGLCYGLGGKMDKVATHVYLLTPHDVEVSAEERQRIQEHGLRD